MKKTLKQINSFIIVLVIALSISATAFAADVESVRPSDADATPRTTISKTVTDSEKNRFAVVGNNISGGKYMDVETAFSVSYYYGGTATDKARVDGYTKSIGVSADVVLMGGGQNSFSNPKSIVGSNGVTAVAEEFLYTVIGVVGHHSFSCNGGSVSFSSNS